MKRILLLFSLFFSLLFYGQNDTLSIVRHTDNDIVTPKYLKVVYRGISNELFIDVPNSKSFEVSGIGITKVSKNIYKLSPLGGLDVIVKINIFRKNNKKITENNVFKIRNIASVISTFNKIEGNQIIKLQKTSLKNGIIGAKVADKNIEELFEVTRFSIKVPGMEAIVIKGNKIDGKNYEKMVKSISKGDQITVSDIKTKTIKLDFRVMCVLTSPMILQIL